MRHWQQWALMGLSTGLLFLLWRDITLALAIVLFLLIHGLGHILFGYRIDINLGIYFILFLGAIEYPLSERDQNKMSYSWMNQAYLAIGGPFVALLAAFFVTLLPVHQSFRSVLYIVSAIHLFNLLPIFPLDGGRLVYAFLTRIHSWLVYIYPIIIIALLIVVWDKFGRTLTLALFFVLVWISGLDSGIELVRSGSKKASVPQAILILLIYVGLVVAWTSLFVANLFLSL